MLKIPHHITPDNPRVNKHDLKNELIALDVGYLTNIPTIVQFQFIVAPRHSGTRQTRWTWEILYENDQRAKKRYATKMNVSFDVGLVKRV